MYTIIIINQFGKQFIDQDTVLQVIGVYVCVCGGDKGVFAYAF